ncbi:hypothetical protein R3P38DRAFT_2842927 [Favolaschia claudopus]|uniref:Uncharacterized protein n=1 Tax=Favolaschia claudopus TaxID=2862362 RepID=A0AAW0E1X2_9AGAR
MMAPLFYSYLLATVSLVFLPYKRQNIISGPYRAFSCCGFGNRTGSENYPPVKTYQPRYNAPRCPDVPGPFHTSPDFLQKIDTIPNWTSKPLPSLPKDRHPVPLPDRYPALPHFPPQSASNPMHYNSRAVRLPCPKEQTDPTPRLRQTGRSGSSAASSLMFSLDANAKQQHTQHRRTRPAAAAALRAMPTVPENAIPASNPIYPQQRQRNSAPTPVRSPSVRFQSPLHEPLVTSSRGHPSSREHKHVPPAAQNLNGQCMFCNVCSQHQHLVGTKRTPAQLMCFSAFNQGWMHPSIVY